MIAKILISNPKYIRYRPLIPPDTGFAFLGTIIVATAHTEVFRHRLGLTTALTAEIKTHEEAVVM